MKTKCPHCGYENILGSDRCDRCLYFLHAKEAPQPGKDKLKKLIMTENVGSFIAKSPPIKVQANTSIQEVLELMHANPTKGCVLVCDDNSGKLIGIASLRDILLKVAGLVDEKERAAFPVAKIMTANPEYLGKDAPLSFALHKMHIGRFRHIPVVDDGVPIGVISTRDIIEYLSKKK